LSMAPRPGQFAPWLLYLLVMGWAINQFMPETDWQVAEAGVLATPVAV